MLRDNDKPATRQVVPSPRVPNVGQWDWFNINPELGAGSQSPDVRERIEDGCVWNAASAASVNLNSRTSQRIGAERYGWAGHFANLDQTESTALGRHIMA